MVTYAKISPKNGEPQRYSWGTQKKKKKKSFFAVAMSHQHDGNSLHMHLQLVVALASGLASFWMILIFIKDHSGMRQPGPFPGSVMKGRSNNIVTNMKCFQNSFFWVCVFFPIVCRMPKLRSLSPCLRASLCPQCKSALLQKVVWSHRPWERGANHRMRCVCVLLSCYV